VGDERFTEPAEIRNGESRMSLFRRLEWCFNADVNLLTIALEPATATRTKRRRLFDFAQPAELAAFGAKTST
jgi:hypothetical protein